MLELAKKINVNKFIYASSSSVYGGNKALPFSVKHRVDNPVSLYAASKNQVNFFLSRTLIYLVFNVLV